MPDMGTFKKRYKKKGAVITAVHLLKGLGRILGLKVIDVPGATGFLDTNYKGKAEYALRALKTNDLVFVHVEAPDEAGHNGDIRAKITAIENFDKFVVGAVWGFLKDSGEYRILVLSDHATPVAIRTHASDPAPFVMAGKNVAHNGFDAFSEKNAGLSKTKFKSGAALTENFIKKV